MLDDGGYRAGIVRDADRPRYYAALYAPAASREALVSVYAFAAELARIPRQVTDPTLGELRLEWWRTAVQARLDGAAAESPVVEGLVAAIRDNRMPVEPVFAMIEARVADLYADPPADRDALEGHLGETESAVFQMAALILAGERSREMAGASGHAGIAYGLARALGGFGVPPGHRLLVPADILARKGLEPAEATLGRMSPALAEAMREIVGLARVHLAAAAGAASGAGRDILPAFLPLAVIAPALDRAERRLEGTSAPLSSLEIIARVSWAAWRGRIGR